MKKAFLISAIGVMLALILAFAGYGCGNKNEGAMNGRGNYSGETNEERVAFLQSFGWQVGETPAEPESAPASTPDSDFRELQDEEYPQLISGGLTKEDLQYLLAYGPETIPEGGFADYRQMPDFGQLLFGNEAESEYHPIESLRDEDMGTAFFSVEDTKRLLSALPSGEDILDHMNINIVEDGGQYDGQYIWWGIPAEQTNHKATITSAEYDESGKKIRVHYIYGSVMKKIAVLTPDETGHYRITKIDDEVSGEASDESSQSAAAAHETGRENYSAPAEVREVMIPAQFDDVYTTYNVMQKAQGFDLEPYAGEICTQYKYKINNYPNEAEVYATLLVYGKVIIGGDISCSEVKGFMHGFAADSARYGETAGN